MRKTFFDYPWIRDRFKRRYMLGCLKAFAKTTATKKFYDLERLKVRGLSAQVDLGFDGSRVLSSEQLANVRSARPELTGDTEFGVPLPLRKRERAPTRVMACGGGEEPASLPSSVE
jgi:anaerobic magnesium-protoporphyrin IX monomethyl ester cyclase